MTEEQRQSIRRILKTKAVLIMMGEQPQNVRTVDISQHGIGLVLPHQINAQKHGRLAFSMYFNGKSYSILMKVKVTHCTYGDGEFKAGFIFTEIPPSSMAAISLFLQQN